MAMVKRPVLLTPGEDGCVVARIPVIPGCISQGKTREEALANIREAALLCLEGREEEGWELPEDGLPAPTEVGKEAVVVELVAR